MSPEPAATPIARRLAWRHLFNVQRSANRAADNLDLLGLCQRLRSGHHMLRTGVIAVAQRANGDRRDVALIGGSRSANSGMASG